MRHWMLVLLMAAIVAAAAWTLIGRGRSGTLPDPWRAVPGSAAVVIEVGDPLTAWDRWSHTARLWTLISSTRKAAAIDRVIDRLARRAEEDAALRQGLSRATVLFAIAPIGVDGLGTLIIWNTADAAAMERVLAGLNGMDGTGGNGGSAGTVTPDSALGALHCAWRSGLALMASDPSLLDEAMRSLEDGGGVDSLLVEARATLGTGTDAHVVVNGTRLPRLLGSLLKAEAVDALEIPHGWTALDLRVRPDALLCSGVLFPEGGPPAAGPGGRALLPPQPSRLIPREAAMVRSFAIGDAARWIEDRGLQQDPVAGQLISWVNGPVLLATAAKEDGSPRTWVVLQGDDPIGMQRALASLCPPEGCDTLHHRGLRLVRAELADGMARSYGAEFAMPDPVWYTVIADKAVFAGDPGDLRAAIDAWLDGRAQADDLSIAGLMEQGGAAAHTTWCALPGSILLLRGALREEHARALDPSAPPWRGRGGITLQCTPGAQGRTFVSLGIEHLADAPSPEGGRAIWTATLPAPLARKPDLTRDHATGLRDVLVQDRDHAIHLFSSAGQVRWSRALDGPIMGEVHQVDRYRNGKLQLLLNTGTRVHMIDRNGRNVEGFPIELKEKATAPMAVFDYENTHDYRMVIPTGEGLVLNLGVDGRSVEGWDPPRLPHPASEAVHHLRIRGKDHLLVIDGAGGMHVWDRRGKVRYKPVGMLGGLRTVVEVRSALEIGSVEIAWLDTAGVLMRTRLDGTAQRVAMPLRAVGYALPAEGPGGRVWIAASRDSLAVVNAAGSAMLLKAFDTPVTAPPMFFDMGAERAIGIACASAARLHLISFDGAELAGSPFTGSEPFRIGDLDLDGRWEVIRGGDRTLVVHHLEGSGIP